MSGKAPITQGFDPRMAGRAAECDGGGLVEGSHFATRQDFAGILTGDYIDHGDPPWRWYLMKDFTMKPEGYLSESVWCESGMLFVAGEEG